jgi:hypothetical protein
LGESRLDHDPAGIPISPVVPAPLVELYWFATAFARAK